ncbi:MAG: ISL3 family transposase [Solirubrobacterales bacterium]|nr:ISL3 family transposase [Solirubrobacterales bacterium]
MSDALPLSKASCWMFEVKRLAKESDMRVTTAFKRMLGLGRSVSVVDVSFDVKGVIVTLRLPKRRRRVCSECGQTGRHLEIVDYRTKRWRHLDLTINRCVLECELRRLRCPDCGVRYEAVRWARPGSPYTRDFEDVVAFLAQQMAKTPITKLMRIAWDSVGDIITRVVTDHFDEARLYGLVLIGVDEISYRRGQRYLTCVADHQRGAIVWAKPGRNAATLQAFFELLGDRRHTIKAISIDMSAGYENAIQAVAEQDEQFRPEVVFDPFHVVQLANRAVDDVRRADWREHGKSKTKGGWWIKHARWSLLKAPERQSDAQLARLAEVAATNKRLYRAFLLKEELRLLYHLPDPTNATEHLDAWLGWASRSKLRPFVKLAHTIRKYRHGILAAVRLRLSNARLEGLNSKVRLISHRSYGFHGPDPLISLIYLCAGGVTINLPFTPNQ